MVLEQTSYKLSKFREAGISTGQFYGLMLTKRGKIEKKVRLGHIFKCKPAYLLLWFATKQPISVDIDKSRCHILPV